LNDLIKNSAKLTEETNVQIAVILLHTCKKKLRLENKVIGQ